MNPLREELRQAFPPAPLDAKGAFRWDSDGELCERAFDQRTWKELDPRLVAERDQALAFLSPERFLAWLPAYLDQLVERSPAASAVWGLLLARLTAPAPGSKARKHRAFEALGDQLTAAQRRVVARSLQLAIERFPAWGERPRLALDRYWGVYAETPTVTQDPWLAELRAAFPPVPISGVFVEDDWQYGELQAYRLAVEGKTWEQLDRLLLVQHGEALAMLGAAAVRAVLPMHLHVLAVFAPTPASIRVCERLDRGVGLTAVQCEIAMRYRGAFA